MRATSDRGFSLIEVMIASTLMLFVMGGILQMVESATVLYDKEISDIEVRRQVQQPLHRLGRDVRMIGYNASSVDQPLRVAAPSQITFFADLEYAMYCFEADHGVVSGRLLRDGICAVLHAFAINTGNDDIVGVQPLGDLGKTPV